MEDGVLVSVLVPVFNEEAHIRSALAGMQAQEWPGGALEFLFADGGSTDRTREILQRAAEDDARVRLLENPDRITTAGLNVCLADARGEYVARMDAHSRYPERYLRIGVARLRRGDVASVSGPQIAQGTTAWSTRVALALGTRLGIGAASFRKPLDHEIEVASGFTGIWRAADLRALDGWDEDIYPNEDAELAFRVRGSIGRIVCVPEMAAQYVPRGSLGALRRQYWHYGRGRARTSLKHPRALRAAHLVPPMFTLAVASSILPIPKVRQPARVLLGAYATAVVGTTTVYLSRRSAGAAFLPVVLPTMHLSWGAGFLFAIVRDGVRRRNRA